jgi:hypothetical protein
MPNNIVRAFLAGSLFLGGFGASQASEAVQNPQGEIRAEVLDGVDVHYARHTREHRMWEINRRMQMQQGRRGYGPPPGRGYRRDGWRGGRGYGPRERRYRY